MARVVFHADKLYVNDTIEENKFLLVKNGKIVEIKDDIEEDGEIKQLKGLVLPGLVNGHSHAFQVLLRGREEHPRDFKNWVNSALYPLVQSLSPEDIETASKVAYAQMLQNGITTVAEFHYIHNDRDGSYYEDKDLISKKVINAAIDVGIRTRFLYCGYNMGQKKAQKRFHRTPDEVLRSVDHLQKIYSSNQLVHIGTAPHSLHGATIDMIKKLTQWAIGNDSISHIHMAEQKSDIQGANDKYQTTPIRVLNDNDILNDKLAVVHSIWIDEDEVKLLADNNVKHVYNPLTNMALGDGIAPIPEYIKHNVSTCVGTDANISLNLLKEIRAVEWLQRVNSLEMGITVKSLSQKNRTTKPGKFLFDMGTTNGADALNLPIGSLEEGNYADFIVLDTRDFSIRSKGELLDQVISSMSIDKTLKEVYVGGNLVYSKNKGFSNFDEEILLEKFQAIE